MRTPRFLLAAAALLAATTVQAQYSVNFESDALGNKPNNWQSVQSNRVSFSDDLGANLNLGNYGNQGDGKSLAVNGDDQSRLVMTFTEYMQYLKLDFGNDDPGYIGVGGKAILTLFDGMLQVGQVDVVVNRNDFMDQSISYTGAAFNRATFHYDADLIEIVDNLEFRAANVVPEPSTYVLMATGLAGVAGLARRRRKA